VQRLTRPATYWRWLPRLLVWDRSRARTAATDRPASRPRRCRDPGRGAPRCWCHSARCAVAGWLSHQDMLPLGITWIRSPILPIGLYCTPEPHFPHATVTRCASAITRLNGRSKTVPSGRLSSGANGVLGLSGDRLVRNVDSLTVCHPAACEDVGRIVSFDSRGHQVDTFLSRIAWQRSAATGVPDCRSSPILPTSSHAAG